MEHSQTSAGGAGRRLRVVLVQQGVWDMPLESLPLASAYLKAMVSGDAELNDQVSVEICNFRGRVTHGEMAARLFAGPLPDVIGFSVFGWSQRAFGALAATYKQLNPQGWVIFGGTHVSAQADRVFRLYPEIDVVVNGEGELTFLDLLRARLAGVAPDALGDVQGISWHRADGSVVTNPDRPRIEDLDIIPSPFLTGAVELLDADGRFRYDVALFETNRGCPYKCSFCYWGGAVGQRVRAFSRERLRAELELFARCGVHTVVACDANFGMLPIDLELVDDLIDIKRRHGFPLAFESSWAKNKSKVFYEIVRRMKEAGLRSSFTLALQSLNPDALTLMRRRNMKVNDWRDLVRWLNREGLDCYAELIWGAPGDTVESFLAGYDELAQHVSRIAVYPIMLLPNTEYAENKELYGIVALRGDNDDFEYVLAHRTMTFADNAVMQRFLFWARVMAENAVLRHCWLPLRRLAGWEQSRVLNSLADWADTTTAREAIPLREAAMRGHGGGAPAYAAAIGYLFTEADGRRALELWWQEVVSRQLAADVRPFLDEVYRYDLLTQPVCEPDGLAVVEIGGVEYFHRPDVTLAYDVPGVLARMRADEPVSLEPEPIRVDIYYRTGAMTAVMSTNHEEILHFMGEVRRAGTPLTVP
ncbi:MULTISPECIES: KedN5 family methylcobalamin-dependent radical SAM C-methyltransferase [Micromonospora]|uniref:KedN5 family methylcobalamin-dependent radical SAM C-methyltransferase n=1 Tax=Micromonospora TaxID=1873 RepID=UPI0004C19707|nr:MULTISPECIES: KedN5 family methylcobalamin-dependent radical SAM C-methyltransferase [Micromonospora]MBC9000571.1 KedN5 family methylcobalamin-dependent radical SAM C-methyltransferase [Micromonospora aurantiaca]MDG4752327.1 KedN5 family methylcobalamin-dependent radical SAM C-methyltransferase [Micromonospora sp. WMMD718]OHX01652.1 B12-binding domain-containing radical SAM protein [Micromonospora sp. WMMB235]RNI06987.1 B12-binding domain-containing radical SAM protein [Micromonospora aurant